MNPGITRTLRWYLPSWLSLSILTVALTVSHVARPVVAVLWIVLFVGTVAAIILLVIADELAERTAHYELPPAEVDPPIGLMADVLPPPRSRALTILRQPARRPV